MEHNVLSLHEDYLLPRAKSLLSLVRVNNPAPSPDSLRLNAPRFPRPSRKVILLLSIFIAIFPAGFLFSYFQKSARTVRLLRAARAQDQTAAAAFSQNSGEVLPILYSLLSTGGPPKYISFLEKIGIHAAHDFWITKKREDGALAEYGFLLLEQRAESAIPFLTNLLFHASLRPHAIRSLAYIGPRGIKEIEFRAMHSKHPPQPTIMNDLSPALSNQTIFNLVARFSHSEDLALRRMAVANLRSSERDPVRRLELYTAALADHSEDVRLDALDHLQYDLTAKTQLKGKWVALTNDVAPHVRQRALRLLTNP